MDRQRRRRGGADPGAAGVGGAVSAASVPVTAFVIERARWLRGEGSAASCLLRASDGRMCCLGFYGAACGLSRDELLGVRDFCGPGAAPVRQRPHMAWLLGVSVYPGRYTVAQERVAQERLVNVNDDPSLPEATREAQITALFAEQGIAVTFV